MVALRLHRDQLPATGAPTTIPVSFWAALSQGSPPGKSELQAGAVGCVSAWTIACGWEGVPGVTIVPEHR